jgi:hypothetical protein
MIPSDEAQPRLMERFAALPACMFWTSVPGSGVSNRHATVLVRSPHRSGSAAALKRYPTGIVSRSVTMGVLDGSRECRVRVRIGHPSEYLSPLSRDRWFESSSLQRRVRCEPDFRGRIPDAAYRSPMTSRSNCAKDSRTLRSTAPSRGPSYTRPYHRQGGGARNHIAGHRRPGGHSRARSPNLLSRKKRSNRSTVIEQRIERRLNVPYSAVIPPSTNSRAPVR